MSYLEMVVEMKTWLGRYRKFRYFVGAQVWRLFYIAILVGVAWFAVETSFVYVFQIFLAAFGLVDRSKILMTTWFPSSIEGASLLLIAFGVCRAAALFVRGYFSGISAQSFIRHQKLMVLKSALRSEGKISSSEAITMFNDATEATGLALRQLITLIIQTISVMLFTLYGVIIAPFELITASVFLIGLIWPLALVERKIKEYGESSYKEREDVNRTLVLGLKNNFFLRLYQMIESEIERGDVALQNLENNVKYFYRLNSFRVAFPAAAGTLILSVVCIISVKYFKTPPFNILAFLYIFIRLVQTIGESYYAFGEVRLQVPAFKSLFEWHQRAQENPHSDSLSKPAQLSRKEVGEITISIKDLDFFFEDRKIISKLNLEIRPHEIFLIKGESGVGKSTLLSLILGILQPASGSVLINGKHSTEFIQSLASIIGYVGPDPYLVPGTVKENLLYGLDDKISKSDQEIWSALKMADLEIEIQQLPGKLNELIFEWAQFSTGQKQRLAIARALLRDPVLLVLDEATANIDSQTESRIISVIKAAAQTCTVIVVSHKSSFDSIADQKLVMTKFN